MKADPPIPTPADPEYFDYRPDAERAGLTADNLARVARLFEADYPHDLMLRELHILRVCQSIAGGLVDLPTVLRDLPPASAA